MATANPFDDESPFGSYGHDFETSGSWASSLVASSTIYVLLGLVLASGMATKTYIERKKPVPVKFVEKVAKPRPVAPPPPKPIEVKPIEPKVLPRQAMPAPAVPKDLKVRKLDKPPPPKELVAPKDMPIDAAPEADPSLDQGIAVYGDGPGDAAGLEGGFGGIPGGIVQNPDRRAIAAVRPDPPYPAAALSEGREGSVHLRCIVLANGKTHSCQVIDGESEFANTAVDTVTSKWEWKPAELQGKAVNAIQSVVVNFKIQVG